jgi:methylphosphotriester-DNA--protein-cysteine methyltransferase
MTHSYIRKVERAYHAATFLEQGESIADTVFKAGYFDQAHMTKAFKHMIGYTPARLASINKP